MLFYTPESRKLDHVDTVSKFTEYLAVIIRKISVD